MCHISHTDVNFFEVHKNIRFTLDPLFDTTHLLQQEEINKNDLNLFIQKYDFVLKQLSSILFNRTQTRWNSKLKIKFCFLKKYTKSLYFENNIDTLKNKHKNQIEMSKKELAYLVGVFKMFLAENLSTTQTLKEILYQPSDQNKDIVYFFHKILRKNNFYFLKDLCESINTEIPNIYEKITSIKKIISELENIKPSLEHNFYQQQSFWKILEIANLNYFLVNKNKINYSECIENKQSLLRARIISFSKLSSPDEKNGIKDLESHYKMNYSLWEITHIYERMKEYKRCQKEWFIQCIEKWFHFQDIKNHQNFLFRSTHFSPEEFELSIYLFDDITRENFEIIKDVVIKISFLKELKNTQDYTQEQKERFKILFEENLIGENFSPEIAKEYIHQKLIWYKKRKWYFFNTENRACMFWKYAKFCHEYKKIAWELWKIKAFIKNLKEEEKENSHTKSWALILEKDGQKFLLTIPKELKKSWDMHNNGNNILKARHFITSQKHQSNDTLIYYFESLNLATLAKLCFSKGNSYLRNKIAKELSLSHPEFIEKKQYYKQNQIIEVYNIKMKYELPKNVFWETCTKILLHFYQSIIQLSALKEQIIIQNPEDFDTLIHQKFDTLETFEQKLKEVCYIKKHIPLWEENTKLLIQNFQGNLYKISSYDLKKCQQRKNIKSHTKIWIDFWSEKNNSEKYPIRINPEIKISFIQKKYPHSTNFDNTKINRLTKDRFILTTHISENACHKSWKVIGHTQKEIIDFYENFNKIFDATIPSHLLEYNYIIDIYENNLIQLSIYQNRTPLEITIHELQSNKFLVPNEKGTPVYKNISYIPYDTHRDFYNVKNLYCIDLQRVKLIHEKIYIDGDISTYLQFKMMCAKKKISTYWGKNSTLIWSDDMHNLVLKNTIQWDICVYSFDERYETIISKSILQKELEYFLERKNIEWYFDEDTSIQSINNLKNALCANIVWVIFFLQKTYPGKIYIRKVKLKKENSSFDSLHQKVEEKILQKLASLSLIPSDYKHIFDLKEKNILKKLWLIEFID